MYLFATGSRLDFLAQTLSPERLHGWKVSSQSVWNLVTVCREPLTVTERGKHSEFPSSADGLTLGPNCPPCLKSLYGNTEVRLNFFHFIFFH